jgi:hypothetical protein
MSNEARDWQQQVAESPPAGGFTVFAAVIMVMAGFSQAFVGLVGVLSNDYFLAPRKYIFEFDANTWGWIHLLVGILVLVAGGGVLTGQTWARAVGITFAAISALSNFAFIPYSPVWSVLVIALDVLVIWALAIHHQPKS